MSKCRILWPCLAYSIEVIGKRVIRVMLYSVPCAGWPPDGHVIRAARLILIFFFPLQWPQWLNNTGCATGLEGHSFVYNRAVYAEQCPIRMCIESHVITYDHWCEFTALIDNSLVCFFFISPVTVTTNAGDAAEDSGTNAHAERSILTTAFPELPSPTPCSQPCSSLTSIQSPFRDSSSFSSSSRASSAMSH